MKKEMVKLFPFSKADVEDENKTLSLLRLLSIHGCLSEAYQKQLKNDLDALFLELAGQYTRRESSTLSGKAAEKIYASVLYQADVYLNGFQDVFEAAQVLCTVSIGEIVLNGQRLILEAFEKSKEIFRQVYKTRLIIPIQEYQYVIHKAFDDFLKYYDARFDAQDVPASIDYPLLYGNWMKEKGIFYIKAYYTALMLENRFCRLFSDDEIFWILKQYGVKYCCRYTDLLFNIAEIVLINLLANLLLQKEGHKLYLTEEECRKLQSDYANSTKAELEEAVREVFQVYEKAIIDKELACYLEKYLQVFSLDFYMRVQNNNLQGYLCYEN